MSEIVATALEFFSIDKISDCMAVANSYASS